MQPDSSPTTSLLEELTPLDPKFTKAVRDAAGPNADATQLTSKCMQLMTQRICELLNARQYDHPLWGGILSPTFTWIFQGDVAAATGEEWLDRMAEAARINTDYRLDCLSSEINLESAEANEVEGFLTMRSHGSPIESEADQVREINGHAKWKREDGKWFLAEVSTMRGNFTFGWESG